MPIVGNRYYQTPLGAQIGAGLSNLAQAFAPPSGPELAGYATANARQQEASRFARLFEYAQNPQFDQSTFDRLGQATGQWTPSTGYYGVDANNARALEEERIRQAGSLERQLAAPIAVNQDQRVFLPQQTQQATGLGPELGGYRSPLSETQWQAQQNERLRAQGTLTDDDLLNAIVGERAPVQAIGPDGKPVFMSPGAAVRQGAQPAPREPQTVVNLGPNGIDYGEPGKGLVWQRNPDGTVALDERGAPIAIPFQGGEAWAREQAAREAAEKGDQRRDIKQNIVTQDIDRALAAIDANPRLSTGVLGQATGAIGGTPAHDLNAIMDSVRANVSFDQLQAMREASPTGGALGQVSDFENRMLQSVMGSLETSQSADQLRFNLERLRRVVDGIVNGVNGQPITPENIGLLEPAGDTAPAQPAAAAPAPGRVRRYNPTTGRIE